MHFTQRSVWYNSVNKGRPEDGPIRPKHVVMHQITHENIFLLCKDRSNKHIYFRPHHESPMQYLFFISRDTLFLQSLSKST